jgi:hypothetical protein
MVTSIGMSATGASVITPCTRHDLHVLGKVGAKAEISGQDMGETEATVFTKNLTEIDPPGSPLCASVDAEQG